MKIYFAGPLFSEAERNWIRSTIKEIQSLAAQHGAKVEIIFPYDLTTQEEIDHLGPKAKHEIFSRCKSHLDDTDLVIAFSMALRWMMGLHGRSGISTPENHPNRKSSGSGLISVERVKVKAR